MLSQAVLILEHELVVNEVYLNGLTLPWPRCPHDKRHAVGSSLTRSDWCSESEPSELEALRDRPAAWMRCKARRGNWHMVRRAEEA